MEFRSEIVAQFPIPPSFGDVVCEWVHISKGSGCGKRGYLASNSTILQHRNKIGRGVDQFTIVGGGDSVDVE